MKKRVGMIVLGAALAAALTGCVNLFGGIDHPSGDAQLISAARACLDSGDYQCALNDYEQVSSDNPDTGNSGAAFTVFAQEGATMESFAMGFGNGKNANIGTGFTSMANSIRVAGAGPVARANIYNAFLRYQSIGDPGLSALVEFLGATAFASEILSEMAPSQSSLTCSDVTAGSNPVACTGAPGGGGGPLGTCMATGNTCGSTNFTASNVASGVGTLDMFNAAVLNIQDGISRIGGSSSFTSSFNSAFATLHLSSLGCGGAGATSTYLSYLSTAGVGDCP